MPLETKMKRIRVLLLTSSVIGTVISVIAQVHSDTEDESSAIPVIVRRRPSSDFYTILQQSTTQDLRCDVNNATYLVKENQCISDNHLFSGNFNINYTADQL